MNQMYDVAYVRGLEKRIRELETKLRDWQVNGVKLTLEEKLALAARQEDQRVACADEVGQIRQDKLDRLLDDMDL